MYVKYFVFFYAYTTFATIRMLLNMNFKDLVAYRRSHRQFSTQKVTEEDLHTILRSALMSPTSKSCRKWQFIVTENRSLLAKMAKAKKTGGQFLESAPLAIVVCAPPSEDDCWIEDAAIAAVTIQYQAAELNLGSCWIQMRNRVNENGIESNKVLHEILDLNSNIEILCVIAIGHYLDERKPQNEEKLKWDRVIKR